MRTRLTLISSLFVLLVACQSPELEKELNPDEKAVLDSMLYAGIDATRNLQFEEAQRLLNQVIDKAEASNNPDYIVIGYINLGNLYNYYSLYDQSLENLFIALEKADYYGIEIHKNAILNNIGIAYSRNGSSEKASEYFLKALAISREAEDTMRIAMNLTNLSNGLSEQKLNDSALVCLEEALQLYYQSDQGRSYRATLNNIGSIYLKAEEPDTALYFFTSAYFNSSAEEVEPWMKWEFALNLARAHFDLGQLDSSQTYLDECIDGFRKGNDHDHLINALKLQSKVLMEKGRENDALAAATEAMGIQDSIVNVKAKNWVSKYQLNYEFGKKEKELELIEAEAERKQLIWILGSIGLALFLILVLLLARSRVARLNQKNLLLEKEQSLIHLRLEKNFADQKRMKEEHEIREKISIMERENLQNELDYKNRSLMSTVMSVSNQNEQMRELADLLDRTSSLPESEMAPALANAKKLIQNQMNLQNDWETVKLHFEEVHPNFFSKLSKASSSLNSSDLRMCAYLVLDLSPKEIANILNITPASIRKRKQRLKEKLNIDKDLDLNEWLRTEILNSPE